MKTMNHSIVRCVCAVLVGVLLVAWSDAAPKYLVMAVGALFLLPGIFTVVTYLLKGRNIGMPFPLMSIGSGLLGLWLMIMPDFFISILMYVLGAVLVFAGISQVVNLVSARGWTQVPAGYYIVPILLLAAGLVVLVNPFAAAAIPFMIVGVSCIVYGVSALVNQIRFRKEETKPVIEEAEIVEVTPIEE